MNPTVKEMVKAYLEEHGFGGLYRPGECACWIKDLAPPCDCLAGDCVAGYDAPCTDACTHEGAGERPRHIQGDAPRGDAGKPTPRIGTRMKTKYARWRDAKIKRIRRELLGPWYVRWARRIKELLTPSRRDAACNPTIQDMCDEFGFEDAEDVPMHELEPRVFDWLKRHGFDGLFSLDDHCGCRLPLIGSCEQFGDCEAGYWAEHVNCPEGCDWHIQRSKPRPQWLAMICWRWIGILLCVLIIVLPLYILAFAILAGL